MINNRKINSYAYDLVTQGKVCFSQLSTIEKNTLTGLLIEKTRLINCYECISDADIKSELPYMLGKFMETGNTDLGKDILAFMKDNAARFMSKQIDELLEEQRKEYEFNKEDDGA